MLPWLTPTLKSLENIAHPCVLLQGSPYIGVRKLAFIYANYLICNINIINNENYNGNCKSCKTCQSCLLFFKNEHPDVNILEKQIGVDDLDFLKNIYQKPHLSHKKVIILEVNALSNAAQHLLLKILEEPPHFLHFILYQEQKKAILPTIQSRLLKIDILPPSFAEGVAYLQQQTELPSQPLVQRLLAQQPLWLETYDLSIHQNIINYMLRLSNTSSSPQNNLQLTDFLKKIGDQHPIQPQVLFLMHQLLHALMLAKHQINSHIFLEHQENIQKIAQKFSIAQLEKLWQMLLNIMKEAQIAVNLKLTLAQFFYAYQSV